MKKKMLIALASILTLATGVTALGHSKNVITYADTNITTYLVLSSVGKYNGESGENFDAPLYLENTVKYEAKAGSDLPGKNEITAPNSAATFDHWEAYEGTGFPTVYTKVPNSSGKILYAFFANSGEEVPVQPEPVTNIYLDKTEMTLGIGSTYTLVATIYPENATNKTVIWTTSDDEVAEVNENGLVTAIAVGETDITVTTADGGYTATCHVTVEEKAALVDGYYLVGSMTEWKPEIDYLMSVNPGNVNEQMITWNATAGQQVKVIYFHTATGTSDWKNISNPDNMGSNAEASGGNAKIILAGSYTLYVDTTDNHYWFNKN